MMDDIMIDALATEFCWPESQKSWLFAKDGIPKTEWEVPERLIKANLSADTKLVVELGSFLGDSAKFIADNAPNATVVCIDHWMGSDEHQEGPYKDIIRNRNLFEAFVVSCWNYRKRIIPIRARTVDGLRIVSRFGLKPDVIYIDAAHDSVSVTEDLNTSCSLFPDAVLIGDDYEPFRIICENNGNPIEYTHYGVRRAVNKFVYERGWGVQVAGRGWQIIRREHEKQKQVCDSGAD